MLETVQIVVGCLIGGTALVFVVCLIAVSVIDPNKAATQDEKTLPPEIDLVDEKLNIGDKFLKDGKVVVVKEYEGSCDNCLYKQSCLSNTNRPRCVSKNGLQVFFQYE